MSKTATTIFIYSFYLFLTGLGMMLVPNTLLPVFNIENTTEVWIRILGLFTCTTGICYFHSARINQVEFFKATIAGRLFFFFFFCDVAAGL